MNKAIDWDTIKQKKISIGTALIVLFAVLWELSPETSWHHATFLSRIEASEVNAKIITSLENLERKQTNHLKEYSVDRALEKVSRLEDQLFYVERDLAAQEQTFETNKRWNEINTDLRHAEEYKECLVRERINCHLLDR